MAQQGSPAERCQCQVQNGLEQLIRGEWGHQRVSQVATGRYRWFAVVEYIRRRALAAPRLHGAAVVTRALRRRASRACAGAGALRSGSGGTMPALAASNQQQQRWQGSFGCSTSGSGLGAGRGFHTSTGGWGRCCVPGLGVLLRTGL